MEKLHIDRVVILEGKYDKIKLSSITDAMIITTDGFGIFKKEEKRALIKRLALEKGIIILSDSDSAGMLIRNYIRSFVPGSQIIDLYIPKIVGKEKRKVQPSKEGTIGVEGMDAALLYEMLKPYESGNVRPPHENITKLTLFCDGFAGGENSSEKRKALLNALSLPDTLSSAALVEAVNLLGGKELYESAKEKISEK